MSYNIFHPGLQKDTRVEVHAAWESVQSIRTPGMRRPKDEPRVMRGPCTRAGDFERYVHEQITRALVAAGHTGD